MPKYPEFKSKPIKGLEEEDWGKMSAGSFNRSINMDWDALSVKRVANTDYQARNAKINWDERNAKIDWKTSQEKRLNSIDFETRSKKYSKVISQFDKQGNFIQDWDSCRKAALELGFSQANINSVCLGKNKTAYGFIWKFKLEQN